MSRGDFPDPARIDTNTLFSPTKISHTRRYSQRINKNPGIKSPRANSFVQLVRNNWNNLSSDIVNRWLRNKMFYLEILKFRAFYIITEIIFMAKNDDILFRFLRARCFIRNKMLYPDQLKFRNVCWGWVGIFLELA